MNSINTGYKRPSERAARFILGIFGWIRYIVGSPRTFTAHGQVIQHDGRELETGITLQYQTILIVEDDPVMAHDFIEVIRDFYEYGSVRILVAHAHNTAESFFREEDVKLVVMDADLDDMNGDGITLTRSFISRKPDLVILANSSSAISNLKLTGFGAVETVGKNPEKLQGWLLTHDVVGRNGRITG